jgi:hypothetical protein
MELMMSIILATQRAARLAAMAVALSAFGPAAYGQQPSAAAMATAKELIATTGSTNLFNPLIAGVIEQAKILYLQQDPSLAKDLNEIAAKMRSDLKPRFAEITDEVAREYASKFTEAELKTMLVFYQSSMKFAQDWANKLSDEVVPKMRDELKKRGHNL